MNIEILIPTYKKSKDQLLSLCKELNIQSNTIIANQNNNDCTYEFSYNGNVIKVIETNTIGVSKNRNILLKNFNADVGLFIDDDCRLKDGYLQVIKRAYKTSCAEAILFNGERDLVNGLINKKIKSKYIKHFTDVSYAGCPGLSITQAIKNYNVTFDERIGTPNYIYCGEDSLFLKHLVDNKVNFYLEFSPIFKVLNDVDNSSYFKGFDEQYIISYGALGMMVHPCSHSLYSFYRILKLRKKAKNISFTKVAKLYKKGLKEGKKLLKTIN